MGRPVKKQRRKCKKNAGDEREKQVNDKFLYRMATWDGAWAIFRNVVTGMGGKPRGPGLVKRTPTHQGTRLAQLASNTD
ncbi:MAG: hypothetical protein P8K79_11100 [Mariniblastus sp.]|nr:hypothetical protein [Mariniblastus sp.]